MSARKCDGCLRMAYAVEKVAVLVAGRVAHELRMCRSCRSGLADYLTRGTNARA